jgi:hypothetical protein
MSSVSIPSALSLTVCGSLLLLLPALFSVSDAASSQLQGIDAQPSDAAAVRSEFEPLFSWKPCPDYPALVRRLIQRVQTDSAVQDLLLSMSKANFVSLCDRIESLPSLSENSGELLFGTLFKGGDSDFYGIFDRKFGALYRGLGMTHTQTYVTFEQLCEHLNLELPNRGSWDFRVDISRPGELERVLSAFEASGRNDLLLKPQTLLALIEIGIRFPYGTFIHHVPHSTEQLNAVFPLLALVWFDAPWGLLEDLETNQARQYRHELQRLPIVLEFFRSLDADGFKIIEEANLAANIHRACKRLSVSSVEGPLLSEILGTREKEGRGTLLEWFFARNDTVFTDHVLSKHPLNLRLSAPLSHPLAVAASDSHPYSPCSGHHSSVKKLGALTQPRSCCGLFRRRQPDITDPIALIEAALTNISPRVGKLLNAKDKGLGGATLLHCSIRDQDSALTLALLKTDLVDVKAKDAKGRMPIHMLRSPFLFQLLQERETPTALGRLLHSDPSMSQLLVRQIVDAERINGTLTLLRQADLFPEGEFKPAETLPFPAL